jgi:hypothetical protein
MGQRGSASHPLTGGNSSIRACRLAIRILASHAGDVSLTLTERANFVR